MGLAMAKRGLLNIGKRGKREEAPVREGPRAAEMTVGDYANGMPNIRIGEMFKSFGRQLPWLIPVFLIGSAAAWYFTKDFKRSYYGDGSILVQLGPEYIYESVTREQGGNGLLLTPDHITQNEIAIMTSSEVLNDVIGRMKSDPEYGERFAGKEFRKIEKASGDEQVAARAELRTKIANSFSVAPKPKSSIVDLSFKHEDGEVAVQTLNAFIEAYKEHRKIVFVLGAVDNISERRKATERQLQDNERAINRFLQKSGVSDFTSERGGVQKRTEELRAALNKLRGEMAETEAGLATVENQLRGLSPQINLYVDDRASQRVAQAELELKQLLAKYLPTSDPVRLKQTEIAELKSLQSANNGKAVGGRRVGPNPVYQELLTRRNMLQSTADSYREKEFTLQRQLDSADAKVRKLQSLSPEYQNLLRERDALDARVKSYTTKEQEAILNQEQAQTSAENIREISRATLPRKGRNMRLFAFALATLGWGFTLFMLAMLRVFLDPKLYANPGPKRGRTAQVPDYEEIPEPVAPYQPDYNPAIAPAAASAVATPYAAAAYGGGGEELYGGAQAVSAGDMAQAYADPNAGAMMMEAGTMPAEAMQMGNTAAAYDLYDNPYLSGATAGQLDSTTQDKPQDEPGSVPVLGTVPPDQQT